ncbi:MAG: hypothetical protein JXB88_10925 [Spirochaetales bacterium]|nr:hypothetical protein [Spirochaetales bacterium]
MQPSLPGKIIISKREIRNVKKVPFLELKNGRLQGVVSSGSDIMRVYVSFIQAGDFQFNCRTNNNRPCAGIGANYFCKHITTLITESCKQYGIPAIAKYLKIPEVQSVNDIFTHIKPRKTDEHAADIFSRFLDYLRFLELEPLGIPVPEMDWYI